MRGRAHVEKNSRWAALINKSETKKQTFRSIRLGRVHKYVAQTKLLVPRNRDPKFNFSSHKCMHLQPRVLSCSGVFLRPPLVAQSVGRFDLARGEDEVLSRSTSSLGAGSEHAYKRLERRRESGQDQQQPTKNRCGKPRTHTKAAALHTISSSTPVTKFFPSQGQKKTTTNCILYIVPHGYAFRQAM